MTSCKREPDLIAPQEPRRPGRVVAGVHRFASPDELSLIEHGFELHEMLRVVGLGPETRVPDCCDPPGRYLTKLHACIQWLGCRLERHFLGKDELYDVAPWRSGLRDWCRHFESRGRGRLRDRRCHRKLPLALVLAEDVPGQNPERLVAIRPVRIVDAEPRRVSCSIGAPLSRSAKNETRLHPLRLSNSDRAN